MSIGASRGTAPSVSLKMHFAWISLATGSSGAATIPCICVRWGPAQFTSVDVATRRPSTSAPATLPPSHSTPSTRPATNVTPAAFALLTISAA